ncbi:MAG: amidohydrolase family protein [Thermoplasmata archaeon]
MGVTDCHVHVNPLHEMRPESRAILSESALTPEFLRMLEHPEEFLAYLDRSGVERAVLVNYVSHEVIGYSEKVNDFVSHFASHDPERLIAVGGVLPTHRDPGGEVRRLVEELGIRALKMHPPHQLFPPNAYVTDHLEGLRAIYEEAERLVIPVIFHTGTSVFPGARNRFGNPLLVEDVAIDFPALPIVLAHGGRPFWTEEAMFLTRRFSNVYLEVSGVPPSKLLDYFPQLPRLADRVLFGSDWPGPGVRDIGANVRAVRELPLSADVIEQILEKNPEKVFRRKRAS